MKVLVIGAGLAGLTAARALTRDGHAVQVVDRNRAPGGRIATRRILDGDADRPEHASMAFDHGAQYFTVRDPAFAAEVEDWHKARVVQVWHGKLASFDSEGREAVEDDWTRWVGVPGMSAIARHLAHGLDVRCSARVEALEAVEDAGAGRWQARLASGETLGPYDAVVVSVPAPHALPLVASSPALAATVGGVRMHPCWSALVAFDDRVLAPFDGAFVTSSPLGWIARNRSKPQRGLAETWVLHASGLWSTSHFDDDASAVAPFLLNAFADLVRAPLPRPIHVSAHRWRYACADPSLNVNALVDVERRLVVCGDWCAGSRMESAFKSGLAAAEAVQGLR
jgi:predicted NAD/FAD-dependent oxidoreductase